MAKAPLPQLDQDRCTGCGKCVEICPTAALGLRPVRSSAQQMVLKAAVRYPERCTYCLACEEICPVNAIALPFQIVMADACSLAA